jgi:hypothetical protein
VRLDVPCDLLDRVSPNPLGVTNLAHIEIISNNKKISLSIFIKG